MSIPQTSAPEVTQDNVIPPSDQDNYSPTTNESNLPPATNENNEDTMEPVINTRFFYPVGMGYGYGGCAPSPCYPSYGSFGYMPYHHHDFHHDLHHDWHQVWH